MVATATALQQGQSAITDERGFYDISSLPPGDYKVTFYYVDLTVESAEVTSVSKTIVNAQIDTSRAGPPEAVHVQGSNGTIVPLSARSRPWPTALIITAHPPAVVLIDGENTGRNAPTVLPVSTGHHVIELRYYPGGEPEGHFLARTFVVDVADREWKELNADLTAPQ